MARNRPTDYPAILAAGALAWIIPGAGHVFLGRKLRGLILFVFINALFWSGVAIGGVFTVNPRQQRWWCAAQMFTGACGTAGWYRQTRAHAAALGKARERVTQSGGELSTEQAYKEVLVEDKLSLVYPAETVAIAYSGIAGMLNLICIIDAAFLAAMGAFGEPRPPKGRQEPAE